MRCILLNYYAPKLIYYSYEHLIFLGEITVNIFKTIRRMHTANRTFRELSKLSDRDLSDIGISRSEIRSFSHRITG